MILIRSGLSLLRDFDAAFEYEISLGEVLATVEVVRVRARI